MNDSGRLLVAQANEKSSQRLDIMWEDQYWLRTYPLTEHTVLDYFSFSPFYDKQCNNEQLKMQRIDLSRLRQMTGVEYELVACSQEPADPLQSSVFTVAKQWRHSPTSVTPLALYYGLAGKFLQAPSIATVFQARVRNTICHLNAALDDVRRKLAFDVDRGHHWALGDDDDQELRDGVDGEANDDGNKSVAAGDDDGDHSDLHSNAGVDASDDVSLSLQQRDNGKSKQAAERERELRRLRSLQHPLSSATERYNIARVDQLLLQLERQFQ
jgi:MED6 mediator sub complex component